MTEQTTGWQSKATREAVRDHRDRQREANRLRRQHIGDFGLTAEELLAKHRALKADYLRRQEARAS